MLKVRNSPRRSARWRLLWRVVKPFAFKHAEDLWAEGQTLLHVYALVDLERDRDLAALIGV
ncbi:hypothetical protein GCM10027074_59380 [Streptomyces deserti]